MKTFEVSADLLQAIANYLATQPYKDVAKLMVEMSKLLEQKKEPEVEVVK